MKFSAKFPRRHTVFASGQDSNDTHGAKASKSRSDVTRQRSTSCERVSVSNLEDAILVLKELFGSWDTESLCAVFEAYDHNLALSIDAVLRMNATVSTVNEDKTKPLTEGRFTPLRHRVRLPDDFLRVPGSRSSLLGKDTEEKEVDGDFSPLDSSMEEEKLTDVSDCMSSSESPKANDKTIHFPLEVNAHTNEVLEAVDETNNNGSEKPIAATLYSADTADSVMNEEDKKNDEEDRNETRDKCYDLPAIKEGHSTDSLPENFSSTIDNSTIEAPDVPCNDEANISSDMHSEERSSEHNEGHELRPSLLAQVSSNRSIGARPRVFSVSMTQFTPLDISGAESRISKKRESHAVFDYLAKSSLLYQKGVINASELEVLRNSLLNGVKRVRTNRNAASSPFLTEPEWHALILKCKGLRLALSVRILRSTFRTVPGVIDSGYAVFLIRVVDIETAAVWFISRRFKEFYKLHKKLSQLSPRVAEVPFPNRRPTKLSDEELANERQPLLEAFLRVAVGLVSPLPIDFLRGCALKELQRFLDVPKRYQSLEIMQVEKWKSVHQNLHVTVYQILNDPQSEEGAACIKFQTKVKDKINDGIYDTLLNDLSTFMDNVQAYMMKHRYETLLSVAQRMGLDETTNDLQMIISDCIRHQIEDMSFVPIMRDVYYYLERKYYVEEESLKIKLKDLRGKPQSYFEIPVEHISASSWESVAKDLNSINTLQLPSDKLRCIVLAANRIHALYKHEHMLVHQRNSKMTEANQVLSGDDFLPIYIYVIVHSNLDHPLVTKEILSALCDPEKRLGETGYYLASFEAAIHHLLCSQ